MPEELYRARSQRRAGYSNMHYGALPASHKDEQVPAHVIHDRGRFQNTSIFQQGCESHTRVFPPLGAASAAKVVSALRTVLLAWG